MMIPMIYGTLTIVGGVMGYIKAGSIASLIAGGASGALILLFAMLYAQQKPMGKIGLMTMSTLLLGWFGLKFSQTGAIMPAGMMVGLSALTLASLFFANSKKPSVTG